MKLSGFESGLMTTVHAYTGDQRVHDFPLFRYAPRTCCNALHDSDDNPVPLSLSGKFYPNLNGKLDGFAIRVPTPNVSVVDLTVDLKDKPDAETVNAALKASSRGQLERNPRLLGT